jgi:hypothetical protein
MRGFRALVPAAKWRHRRGGATRDAAAFPPRGGSIHGCERSGDADAGNIRWRRIYSTDGTDDSTLVLDVSFDLAAVPGLRMREAGAAMKTAIASPFGSDSRWAVARVRVAGQHPRQSTNPPASGKVHARIPGASGTIELPLV